MIDYDPLEEELNQANEAERLRHLEREREDLRHVLGSPQGRGMLWDVLSLCGLYASCTSMDPMAIMYSSARRDVGLAVLERIHEADPRAYAIMTAEATNREEEANG